MTEMVHGETQKKAKMQFASLPVITFVSELSITTTVILFFIFVIVIIFPIISYFFINSFIHKPVKIIEKLAVFLLYRNMWPILLPFLLFERRVFSVEKKYLRIIFRTNFWISIFSSGYKILFADYFLHFFPLPKLISSLVVVSFPLILGNQIFTLLINYGLVAEKILHSNKALKQKVENIFLLRRLNLFDLMNNSAFSSSAEENTKYTNKHKTFIRKPSYQSVTPIWVNMRTITIFFGALVNISLSVLCGFYLMEQKETNRNNRAILEMQKKANLALEKANLELEKAFLDLKKANLELEEATLELKEATLELEKANDRKAIKLGIMSKESFDDKWGKSK